MYAVTYVFIVESMNISLIAKTNWGFLVHF